MKRLWSLILASKLSVVIRLACLCAGLSLFFMVLLVIVKIPAVVRLLLFAPVVFAISPWLDAVPEA